MFTRKVPNTVLYTKPNLTNTILINNSSSKSYFFKYRFTIRDITVSDIIKNIRDVKHKMKTVLHNGTLLQALHDTFLTVPRTLKNQSAGALRVWAHQCECVVAQRLRRGQQMFCLYTKLWEERALKELLTRMRQQIAKRGKELVFSAVGITSYNWDNNRISNDEIVKHMSELDYIHLLTEKTMICENCKQDTSEPLTGVSYCVCGKRNYQNRTFDDWVPFIEKQDMLVWRKLRDSGYYEYKVYGSFNDVSAADFLNVQIDTEYRKKWDTTAITLEVIDKDPTPQSNSDIIYWEMLWPKLFCNRDYVFNRRFMIDSKNKTIIILSRGTKHPSCPVRADKYRVDNYWSYMVMKPYTEFDKPGIEFGLTYFDMPGVNIPSAVTTWVAMRAMPDFLIKLREATKEYRAYCRTDEGRCIYNIYEDQKKLEDEQQIEDEEDNEVQELITDNTVFEPEHPIKKNHKSKSRSTESRNPVAKEAKSPIDASTKATITTPGVENMTSPTIQPETGKHSYWKYLHPNYYFS